jgi:NADH-dependent peroxiredoxin subunit F
MIYDLAIIGGGPAGAAAGVYAARKQLKTIFITKDFEGQSHVSDGVENWIGTIKIPGPELSENLKKHLEAYKGDVVHMHEGEIVTSIEKAEGFYTIKTPKNEFQAKTILITTGSRRKKLEVPGAAQFENKGITYCASCDGPLFQKKDVVVIGGGNAAFESAAQLLAYCKSVTLLQRSAEYRADPVTVQKVLSHPNMKAVSNTEINEIKGEKFVSSIVYTDKTTGQKTDLPVQGIFVEIGSLPNTDFVKGIVDLDDHNHIKVDPWTQRTSAENIWAAGDVTNGLYHQNNIAAGDAVKALEDIYLAIHAKK